MNYGNVVILLARQRSGTNALRSVLETNPEIFCLNEVFSVADRNSSDSFEIISDPDHEPHSVSVREINFFNFQQKYAGGSLERLVPEQHERLFLDFLDYLRCFSSKRIMVIDVKYNTTHFFTEPYKWNLNPYLFYLIRTHGLRVVNLTRKHYLRNLISQVKAERSGHWTCLHPTDAKPDAKVPLPIDYLFSQLNYYDAESQLIDANFRQYALCFTADYEEAFPQASGQASPAFLKRLAQWLNVPNRFEAGPTFRKQSYLPLQETIENYGEVATALRGTKFEYCLNDERCYEGATAD